MGSLSHSQERLLKGIVCGLIPTEKELRARLFMLRCREKPNVPCVLARLTMDMDDPFLTSRWHYGSERLETALRNFFGARQRDMYLHVAVISPEEVRVLCYPVTGDGTLLESAVRAYVEETAQQIDHYLGLHMQVAEVRLVPGLSAFAAEKSEIKKPSACGGSKENNMGIFKDLVTSQLIDVIEWTDDSQNTMVYKYDMNGKEIMMGAQLTVRESQAAIFVNEGKLADVFQPGRYELSTQNMPILTKLKAWKFGFNSPFKSDVYFINTKQFLDRKWGTANPVMMRDSRFRHDPHPGLRLLRLPREGTRNLHEGVLRHQQPVHRGRRGGPAEEHGGQRPERRHCPE